MLPFAYQDEALGGRPLNNQFVQRAKILAAGNDPRSIQTESDPLPLILRQLPERKLCPIFSICLRIHGSVPPDRGRKGILTESAKAVPLKRASALPDSQ